MKKTVEIRAVITTKLGGFLLFFIVSVSTSVAQPIAPYIIEQPHDQAVNIGDSATFSVIAGGTEPLSYQWRRDGFVVQGNSGPSLLVSVPGSLLYMVGRCSVTVTNVAGTVTSRTALLTAPPLPCVLKPADYYWPVPGYLLNFSGQDYGYNFGLPLASQVVKPGPADYEGYILYNRVTFGSGWSPAVPTRPDSGFGWLVRLNYEHPLFFPTNLPPPVLPLDLPPGFSLVCCQYPRDASFEDIVGRPPDLGTRLYKSQGGLPLWPTNTEGTTFLSYAFTNETWSPSVPLVSLGEAVWVLQPPKLPVPQLVSGQLQFPIRTATFATLDLECTDNLDGSSPWQQVAHIVGSGNITNVVDDPGTNAVEHRFYRLRLIPGLP